MLTVAAEANRQCARAAAAVELAMASHTAAAGSPAAWLLAGAEVHQPHAPNQAFRLSISRPLPYAVLSRASPTATASGFHRDISTVPACVRRGFRFHLHGFQQHVARSPSDLPRQ